MADTWRRLAVELAIAALYEEENERSNGNGVTSMSAMDALKELLAIEPDALWSVALRTSAHNDIDTAVNEVEIGFRSLRGQKRRGEIFRAPTLENAVVKAREWAMRANGLVGQGTAMRQIRIFANSSVAQLQKDVNDWLRKIGDHITVVQILQSEAPGIDERGELWGVVITVVFEEVTKEVST
jgi:hypothetical protein